MTDWDHIIKNGQIITANESYHGNIYIKNGIIEAITNEVLPGSSKEITDVKNCYVLPGLMDTHIHSRDPGSTYKEDFYHSTLAAAAGGITSVFEMPNTNPPVNNTENFYKQIENLSSKANVDFGVWGICLGDLNIKDIYPLYDAGVIGFKFFWGYAIKNDTYELVYNFDPNMNNIIPPLDDGEVYNIFKEVSNTGKVLAIHAENNELIYRLTNEIQEKKQTDYEALINSRPDLAELTTIQTGIAFAEDTKAKLHILHLTSKKGVEAVKKAQEKNSLITSETCPQFLFLDANDYDKIGPMMKVYPPVKYRKDQLSLWDHINNGTITSVCSDHAPHTEEEKDGGLFDIPAGMCGVETIVQLMLNAVNERKITLQQLVALMSTNPAKQFDIYPKKGSLEIGTDADITIVDMEKEFLIEKEKLHSKSKVTAFDRFKGKGKAITTIVRGNTIVKNEKVISDRQGTWIKPTK